MCVCVCDEDFGRRDVAFERIDSRFYLFICLCVLSVWLRKLRILCRIKEKVRVYPMISFNIHYFRPGWKQNKQKNI